MSRDLYMGMLWKFNAPSVSRSASFRGSSVQYRYQSLSPGSCPRITAGSAQLSTKPPAAGTSSVMGFLYCLPFGLSRSCAAPTGEMTAPTPVHKSTDNADAHCRVHKEHPRIFLLRLFLTLTEGCAELGPGGHVRYPYASPRPPKVSTKMRSGVVLSYRLTPG